MVLNINISEEDDLKPVKFILKSRLNISERLVKKLKYSGKILLNSTPVYVNETVHTGDVLEAVVEFEEVNEAITPEPLDIKIVYEDEYLVAVDKPAGIVVHPVFSHLSGTIANGLSYHLLQKGVKTLIRPVSRLDRDTSGIILFALNPFIQESLVRQMHTREFLKEYVGLVHGTFNESNGTINLPIDRKPDSIMLRHVTRTGYESVTHFKVLESFDDASFLKFRLETGRTHQIRVHCQAIGHPLVGDTLYPHSDFAGKHEGIIMRQALHSIHTVFVHPYTKKVMDLEAPMPEDINTALEILRK